MGRFIFKRINKYHNKKTPYNGQMYDSKREAAYAQELDLRVKAHDIASWEAQVPLPIVVDYQKICKYVIDFKILYKNGTTEFVEVKGYKTAVWRLKWKLVQAIYKYARFTLVE